MEAGGVVPAESAEKRELRSPLLARLARRPPDTLALLPLPSILEDLAMRASLTATPAVSKVARMR